MASLVRLGVFSPSVVLGVARATGAFDRADLAVEEVPATSSAQQIGAMLAGELDAALTSPDNVLAYRRSAANPLGRTADIRILAAVDRGLGLSLFAGPGTQPDAGVPPSAILAVDVPTSGFAFVGYELLARRGLRRGRDFTVEAVGTTPRRAAALIAGECALTVLNAGSDLRAEAAGCVRLARASSLGPYVGTVLAAPGAAVEDPRGALRPLTAAILETGRAVAEGSMREVAAAIAAERLRLTRRDIERYLNALVDPQEGLVADGRLDAESLQTLGWLRRRHGGADPELAALIAAGSGLVDDRFLVPSAS